MSSTKSLQLALLGMALTGCVAHTPPIADTLTSLTVRIPAGWTRVASEIPLLRSPDGSVVIALLDFKDKPIGKVSDDAEYSFAPVLSEAALVHRETHEARGAAGLVLGGTGTRAGRAVDFQCVIVGKAIDAEQAERLRAKLEQNREELRTIREEKQAAVATIVQRISEEPQLVFNAKWSAHLAMETKMREAQADLQRNQAVLEDAAKHPLNTAEGWRRVDPAMAAIMNAQDAASQKADQLETQFGKQHPAVINLRAEILLRRKKIEEYRTALEKKYMIKPQANGGPAILFPRDLSIQEAEVRRMRETSDKENEELSELGQQAHEVTRLRSQAQWISNQLADIEKQLAPLSEARRGENIRDSVAVIAIGTPAALEKNRKAIDATFRSISASNPMRR